MAIDRGLRGESCPSSERGNTRGSIVDFRLLRVCFRGPHNIILYVRTVN